MSLFYFLVLCRSVATLRMKKRLAAVATSLRFIPFMNTHGSVPRDLIESRAPPPSVSIHSLCHFAVKFTFRRQKYTFTFILPNFSPTFLRFLFKFRINTKNEPTNDGPVFFVYSPDSPTPSSAVFFCGCLMDARRSESRGF